jgi:regulator of CtrA degradation
MSDFGVSAAPTGWRAAVVQDFARSELFERTFQEGMDLVEETAGYLDGAGRQDSKLLSRNAALAYASESMRLTTRLMQVASWLLVQRAVREGDMAPNAACEERYRIGIEAVAAAGAEAGELSELPGGLLELLDRSERLYERVRHLDKRMYLQDEVDPEAPNPVLSQFDRLKSAFGIGA